MPTSLKKGLLSSVDSLVTTQISFSQIPQTNGLSPCVNSRVTHKNSSVTTDTVLFGKCFPTNVTNQMASLQCEDVHVDGQSGDVSVRRLLDKCQFLSSADLFMLS